MRYKIRLFTICLHLNWYESGKAPSGSQSMSRGNCCSGRNFSISDASSVLMISGAKDFLTLISYLFIDHKIEIHPGNTPLFIFRIIPHISSAICDLTGSRNDSGIAGFSVKIKRNPLLFIQWKLFFQGFTGIHLTWSWYTSRVLSSCLHFYSDLKSTWKQKKEIWVMDSFLFWDNKHRRSRDAAW